MKLDIRTYLILTVLSATCASLNTDIRIEIGIIVVLGVMQLLSGKGVFMPKLLVVYGVMVLIQYVLFPHMPEVLVVLLSMLVVNIRSFFPVIMCLVLMYKNTRVSQMAATFTMMGAPKSVTVTVAVAIRYIPTLKEEWLHIRDAMRMRRVTTGIRNPLQKLSCLLECYLAPMFVSCLKTADELSAAAVTRGIDNPAMPTCRNYRAMGTADYLTILCAILVTAFCVWNRYGG